LKFQVTVINRACLVELSW